MVVFPRLEGANFSALVESQVNIQDTLFSYRGILTLYMEQAQKPKAKRELVDIESYFAFVDSGLMVSVVRSSFLTLDDIVKYQFKTERSSIPIQVIFTTTFCTAEEGKKSKTANSHVCNF